jgi:signal transduction histidine kinase
MARRIVLAVLALIAVVLGTVALPLGLLTAAQDRRAFSDETVAATSTLANVAEERLDDGDSARPMRRLVSQLGRAGDAVSVLNRVGIKVDGTARPPDVTVTELARARTATVPAAYPRDGAVLVVAPVRNDNGTRSVGTVVLDRPATEVDRRITVLWWLIAAVSSAGLLVGAVVAVGLARWVSRPLADLEGAAQLLGDGDLGARSPAGAGPGEVRRLAANINLMAGRLETLVRVNRATLADVSHQLRTPLAALRLRLELLAQDADAPTAAELAGAQEEIARLSRLVNGLLAVARAEDITGAPVVVAIDAVIGTRVAAWRPAADEQDITLTATDVEPVQARMGEGHLEQVLDNLLANALDALGPGRAVIISAGPTADRARITVADNGPGMSAMHKRTAFRRFATGTAGGTGLGLAIVDRLVASAGGSVDLSDTDGGGLTVTIDLPAAPQERGQRRAASTARPGPPRHRPRA